MRYVALLLAIAFLWAPSSPLLAQGAARIVAIGDIHGEIDGFKRILQAAGLADASGKWTGRRAQLIQTGDYTDRGTGTRAVLDLLMALERQARSAGGRAFALLGNHEVMNLIGDTRDVTPEIFATFADANSEKKRNDAWEQYARLGAAKLAKGEPVPAVYAQTREAWMAAHPPGSVEYRDAFAPRGKYGAWLREKPIVTEINGTIFMHAGIAPAAAPEKLDDLNVRVRDEIRRLDRFVDRLIAAGLATRTFTLQEILQVAANEITVANAVIAAAQAEGQKPDGSKLNVPLLMEAQEILKIESWVVVSPDGALWYRGLSTEPDNPSGEPFAPLLTKYNATRFVTGHTPQPTGRITVRFGGRAILIDTGMLANYYKGRPAALEIQGDKLTAIYETERLPLATPAAAR
ncbi:MAG TPA: metallophosphoesterase [Vicinamibacterales bacterium]|nr:metallophosphoesterase [Vicinamibacterales bacterium]